MVENQINDFCVVAGNQVGGELETYRLFNIVSDPRSMNGRVLLTLKACDVNVHRAGGWYLANKMFGRQPVVGALDLNKKRETTVSERLFIPIKLGKPSIFLALPDEYAKLPKGIKDDPMLALLFEMFYRLIENEEMQKQMLVQAGLKDSEIQDRLSQSQTMLNEFMLRQVEQFQNMQNPELGKDKKEPPREQPGYQY